jgi:hypothetical protein
MIDRFGQVLKILPVLEPKNITTTATFCQPVSLSNAHRCTFLAEFGSITAASVDQAVTVTVLAATGAATTGATAIAFNYRLSSALATDSWGNVTAATSSGVALNPTGGAAPVATNKILLVDVDPRVVFAGVGAPDGLYVILKIAPDAGASATNVAAQAIIEPRYMVSST